mgnify:CR=1 FL=1
MKITSTDIRNHPTNTFPAISVIVPVYKAEKYLHRCVDSLLAQTFTDFEVLLIDDGSPDRSGEICDGYAAGDNRVRVFHKKNGGVSSARQFGIDNARGEYSIHADPDDWVEPDMLEELYKVAKKDGTDADMVICDFYVNFGKKQTYRKQEPSDLNNKVIGRELFQQLHGSCWNKLVRRACYSENNIEFPERISFCEDVIFNVRLLQHAQCIRYVPRAFYHYEQTTNDNSIVHSYSMERYEEDCRLLKIVQTLPLDNRGLQEASENVALGIAWRAFNKKLFSASEFKRRFAKYKTVAARHHALKYRIFVYAACLGLQDIVHPLSQIIWWGIRLKNRSGHRA